MITFCCAIISELVFYFMMEVYVYYFYLFNHINILATQLGLLYDFILFIVLIASVVNRRKKILYSIHIINLLLNILFFILYYFYQLNQPEQLSFLIFMSLILFKNIIKIFLYPGYISNDNPEHTTKLINNNDIIDLVDDDLEKITIMSV
jgi:hypothetical protein